jgi:hypothetical protein
MASILVAAAWRVLAAGNVGLLEVRPDCGQLCRRPRSPALAADSRQVLADLGRHDFRVKKAAFMVKSIGPQRLKTKPFLAQVLCFTIKAALWYNGVCEKYPP